MLHSKLPSPQTKTAVLHPVRCQRPFQRSELVCLLLLHDHGVLQEASLAESEFPCLGASTISAYKPASKDTTAGEIFEPPISPLLPGWSSSCAWEPPASTDSLRSLAGQPEAAQKVAAAKGDTPPARVNAKPEHVSFNQWVAATRRHCA